MTRKFIKSSLRILALFFLCLVLYVVYLGFFGPSTVTKGSLGYYVNIQSKVIKNFPLPGKIEAEVYLSRADPASNGLNFKSNANKDFLMRTFHEYLISNGYERFERYSSDSEMYYERENLSTIDIFFQKEEDGIYSIFISDS
jgi:hypothetical protein